MCVCVCVCVCVYVCVYVSICICICMCMYKNTHTLSQKVKSFIKDTNDFLKKLNELRDLPDEFILCTIDVVGLYSNIPHKEELETIRKALNKREDQTISTDSLILLAECVLKKQCF